MPPLPHLKAHIKVEIAVILLFMGIAAGVGGWIGHSQVSDLQPPAASTVIEGVASRRTKLTPFWLARLRGLSPADQTPSLVVPPPILPQPLPPQAVGPLPPLSATAPGFTDVPPDHWAYPQLTDLATRQLVAGFPDGSFKPAATMTRAELATQLVQVFDLVNHVPASQYLDVPPSHWASDSISRALQMRFLTGFPDQTFRPEQNVTRLEVIMALASGLSLRSSRPPETVLQAYQDAQQVPDWAKAPLVAALDAGLIAAYPEATKLNPQRLASRAEVITLVHQAMVYTGSLRALPPSSTPPSAEANPPASAAN